MSQAVQAMSHKLGRPLPSFSGTAVESGSYCPELLLVSALSAYEQCLTQTDVLRMHV